MASTAEVAKDILNFSGDAFFSADRSILAPRESRLLDTDFLGIAVNAPLHISTGRRHRLPLIMAARFSGRRDWNVPLRENCILVGTDLEDGTVHFSKVFVSKKELPSRGKREKVPRGPKPPGLALAAAQLTALDARRLLHMEWNTGIWSLGVIYYDWPSNTVEVKLEGDKKIKVPSAARPISPEPDLLDAAALPSYLPLPGSPKLPESGVNFNVETGADKSHLNLIVHGAFSVVAKAFDLPKQKIVRRFKNGRKENVSAVVPVTMAVLGLDWDEPLRFDWAVPVYGKEIVTPGMPVHGFFTIQVPACQGTVRLSTGKYICYIIMDGRIFGPESFEITGVK